MLTYFIYILVTIILIIVIVIAAKAISRGVKAKSDKIKNLTNYQNINKETKNFGKKKNNLNIVNKIEKLNNMHFKGELTDEEFVKEKEKILK